MYDVLLLSKGKKLEIKNYAWEKSKKNIFWTTSLNEKYSCNS